MTDKQEEPLKKESKNDKFQNEDLKTKAATDESVVTEKSTTEPSVDELEKKVTDLTKVADEMEDKFLRAQAEIQNMTTRFNKEREQSVKYDGQKLAKDILPVMDNLERALQIKVDDEQGQQLKKGIEMVYNHLDEALKSNGVQVIEAQGQKFDPTLHQAVQTVDADGDRQPDDVVEVFQPGYKLKDRVLRPAMVVVAK